MRNQFSAKCFRCGKMVPKDEGFTDRWGVAHDELWPNMSPIVKGWLTEHESCAAQYRGTAVHHIYQPAPKKEDGIVIEDI